MKIKFQVFSLLAIVVVLSLCSSSQGQPFGKISGVIRDVENNEPLGGANVSVAKTLLGASTDENGRFIIRRVPPGVYVLKISFIGYRLEQFRVRVQPDSTSQIEIALQPSAIQSETIIVTGSRQQEDLQRAANSVSVVGLTEIRRRNRLRIDESLQSIAGVTLIGENVNVRGGSGYALLGLGASRVLMLIDDVPVLTSDLGRANWDILPVTEVERVEVLKGASSVLYGSGGVSGVVNILTRRPTATPSLSFRQSVGVYDEPSVPQWKWTNRTLHYYRTDASYSQSFNRLGLRLAVSRHESTSDRQNGDFYRWYLTGKAVYNLPDASTLALFATYSSDNRGFFFKIQNLNDLLISDFPDRFAVEGAAASLVYNKLFSPTVSTKIRFSFNSQLIGLPFVDVEKDFKPALGLSAEAQGNWLPHSDHSLVFGVDYKRDEVKSTFYGSRRGEAIAPYVQDVWKISTIWQIHAGLRYDTYVLVGDSAETQFSPKFGASYNILSGSILHFSIGRGFRSPSVAERFAKFSSGGFELKNNPDLLPERSTLLDAGLRQRFGENVSADVTAFVNHYDNLIELDTQNIPVLQFLNYPRTRMRGIETEFKGGWWKNRLGLAAALSWMEAISLSDDPANNLKKNQTLPYRPRWTVFVSPSFSLGAITLDADYRYVSRYDKTLKLPNEVPQKIWDVRLHYRRNQFGLQLGVKNAVNYNYAPAERVLGEIRNFYFAVNGEF